MATFADGAVFEWATEFVIGLERAKEFRLGDGARDVTDRVASYDFLNGQECRAVPNAKVAGDGVGSTDRHACVDAQFFDQLYHVLVCA
jgi:hypothetical protein